MHISPSIFDFFNISPLHPAPIKLRSEMIKINKSPMFMEKSAPSFCQFFWFGSNPNIYLPFFRALIVLLHLGTHPSNTGEELLYYHLYHEEAPFSLDVCPQLLIGLLSFFSLRSQ